MKDLDFLTVDNHIGKKYEHYSDVLKKLIEQPAELQMAYELLQKCREG